MNAVRSNHDVIDFKIHVQRFRYGLKINLICKRVCMVYNQPTVLKKGSACDTS